ncbi:MAG: glycosyltransferase [Acetobacteraceae bacterium]
MRAIGSTADLDPLAGAVTVPDLAVVVPCYNERSNVAPLIAELDRVLQGVAWEVVFVDDDSPDGTTAEVRRIAAHDPRVRCIRRIGRRGLSSAVIEGMLATSAPFLAVMDGDLQHDASRLPLMLDRLRDGAGDLAVVSRHVEGGDTTGLGSRWRHTLSGSGTRLAQRMLPVHLSDPMSGFFMLPRELFERLAPSLTGQGFKILLDIVLSAPAGLRVVEVPGRFRERLSGTSKLDALVLAQFGGLLLDKLLHGLVPLRFIGFAGVGALGVLVHLLALTAAFAGTGVRFTTAQAIATVIAMIFNFQLNNELTYRDQKLRGAALWRGLLLFMVVCGLGAVANIGVARALYSDAAGWTLAGATGAVIGVVWNYAVSATLVWRAR